MQPPDPIAVDVTIDRCSENLLPDSLFFCSLGCNRPVKRLMTFKSPPSQLAGKAIGNTGFVYTPSTRTSHSVKRTRAHPPTAGRIASRIRRRGLEMSGM